MKCCSFILIVFILVACKKEDNCGVYSTLFLHESKLALIEARTRYFQNPAGDQCQAYTFALQSFNHEVQKLLEYDQTCVSINVDSILMLQAYQKSEFGTKALEEAMPLYDQALDAYFVYSNHPSMGNCQVMKAAYEAFVQQIEIYHQCSPADITGDLIEAVHQLLSTLGC